MSRIPNAPSNSGALQPIDPLGDSGSTNAAPSGGVFRLDSMAPGMENAQQAMTAARKSKISNQAIVLGVLLFIGGGLIYGMRLLGVGPMSSLAKSPVAEYDLGKPGVRGSEHKRIIQDLQANHAALQVPIEQVQRNPFKMAEANTTDQMGPNKDDLVAGKAYADKTRRENESRRKRVDDVLSKLKVSSVLGGSSPMALISGEAVRVGDTVGDLFTVKAIHERGVDLEFEGKVYPLVMDDENANRQGKTKSKKN